jgi:tetratricopeptide (TPR) repeat protein
MPFLDTFLGRVPMRRHERAPYLVSLTLTGNNADQIAGALASVAGWVDACIVIDTGVNDRSLAIARRVAGAKYRAASLAWSEDFASARNFALRKAEECGAAWAVMIDTDERLDLRGLDIRAALGKTTADLLLVEHESRIYAKERFFRMPAHGHYVGPTHECFIGAGDAQEQLLQVRFSEVPKSPPEYERKFERDVRILRRYTAEHPEDPRWFYYLGDSLQNLGRHAEAAEAYSACVSLRGWDEEAAWACYRSAECWIALGDLDRAIESCALGLARHAGVAELSWLAGYAAWKAGRFAQAVSWARLSAAMGIARGSGSATARTGFRNPHALYEGPYDVLRFALRALGDDAGADEAEQLYREAAELREAGKAR